MTIAEPVRPSSLHDDLVEILSITRVAEHELFALLDPQLRDAPHTIGDWSAKDLRAHLGAWRAIEARRLWATARREPFPADDPAPNDAIDDSNAALHARHAAEPWDAVARDAGNSYDALIDAIGQSTTTALCECDGTTAGIGANGANHALAHLVEVAELGGGMARYDAFVRDVENVLTRGHLPPRDSGVILYNVACRHALGGELNEARRLLRSAFAHRHDLLAPALEDQDLAVLRTELEMLALD